MADSIIDLFLTLIIGLLIEAIFYRNNLKLFIILVSKKFYSKKITLSDRFMVSLSCYT